MLTLDEAIKHCEEVAEEQDKKVPYKIYDDDEWTEEQENCHKCAEEHRQLAEWLKELKKIKEQQDRIIQILDDYDLEAWEVLEKIKEAVRV